MIKENAIPPFKAYRLTPKRQVVPVEIVRIDTQWSTRHFCNAGNGFYSPMELWETELEALLHVRNWAEMRKAVLSAELANLEVRRMKVDQRLQEIGHDPEA